MVTDADIELAGGRTLHYYDTREDESDTRVPVFWHHGTPNVGSPPEPLFPAAAGIGLRWVSYDRPAYGGSSPNPGRDIASAVADVAAVADALGIGRFAAVGHSGGGRTPWPAGRSCPNASSPWSACPRQLRSTPRDLTGSRDGADPEWQSSVLPWPAGLRWKPICRRPSSTRRSPRRTSPCLSSSCTAIRIGWSPVPMVSG